VQQRRHPRASVDREVQLLVGADHQRRTGFGAPRRLSKALLIPAHAREFDRRDIVCRGLRGYAFQVEADRRAEITVA
jgi:hypothetical protein